MPVRSTVSRSELRTRRRDVTILPEKCVPAGTTVFPFTVMSCASCAGNGVPGTSVDETACKLRTTNIVPAGIVAPLDADALTTANTEIAMTDKVFIILKNDWRSAPCLSDLWPTRHATLDPVG